MRISSRGTELLKTNPPHIDEGLLKQYPEYMVYLGKPAKNGPSQIEIQGQGGDKTTQSPDDMMESGYQALKQKLAQDLLERVMNISPASFENLVVALLVKMGYGGSEEQVRAQITGRSGDGGIDGLINQDRLGLDVIYVQAKRWQGAVGEPVLRDFVGALERHRAAKGVIATTSHFLPSAIEYNKQIGKKIKLINGKQFAELMIEYGIGVATVATYSIKRVDLDYFEEA